MTDKPLRVRTALKASSTIRSGSENFYGKHFHYHFIDRIVDQEFRSFSVILHCKLKGPSKIYMDVSAGCA